MPHTVFYNTSGSLGSSLYFYHDKYLKLKFLQFDICDEQKHFASSVPSRAMTCPILLNAIYTISARHLSRIKKYYVGDQIRYQNTILPDLKPETALFYHNRCIEHLVSLSDDPMEVNDETLLAAAVILRFYEEVDG